MTIDIRYALQSWFRGTKTFEAQVVSYFKAISPAGYIDEFYDKVFNIDTAVGFGLDIWGRIVGFPRSFNLKEDISEVGNFLRFAETGKGLAFGFAPLYSTRLYGPLETGPTMGSSILLEDEAYRRLLKLKMFTNISPCTIPNTNKALTEVFKDRGVIYVRDNLNMTMALVTNFELTALEKAVLTETTIIPRVCGVMLILIDSPTPPPASPFFSFKETGVGTPFGVSPFA